MGLAPIIGLKLPQRFRRYGMDPGFAAYGQVTALRICQADAWRFT
jgi:hypothetical protein